MAKAVAAPAPDPAPSVSSAALRDRYADLLWRHIAARRPQGIRLSGEAELVFTVDRSGAVSEIAIGRSSGNAMLDRLALRTVQRAAPMPAPPEALGKGPFRFTIAVTFE